MRFIAGNMNQELGWLNKFSINHNRSKNPKTSMPTTGEAAQEPCTLQKDSEPEKTLALKGLAIIIPTHDTHKHKSHLQPEMADICKMNTIELLTAELIGALDNILQTKKRITAQQTKGQDTSQDTWEKLAECKEI